MKKSKRLLALLLSVMLITGTVFAVPFTASAETVELQEVGASSVKFSELNILGGQVIIGSDYYSLASPDVTAKNPVYAWFDTTVVGHHFLYIKNNGMTTEDVELSVSIVDFNDKELAAMTVKDGEEKELNLKVEKTGRYYIKLNYDYKNSAVGGNIDLKVNAFEDAEPDKMDPACTVKAGVYFTGYVDVAVDKDCVFVNTADSKRYSITLENKNDVKTAFKAEVYDSKSELVATLTTEEEDTVTLDLEKPKDTTSYYVCVTGVDGALGYYGVMMNEIKPVAAEVPLDEEFYDSIAGYQTEGGKDYLKFTTIDKDAYYTITAKNINITTHSWSADNEVQVPLYNANDEELGRVYLTEGQEKSMTYKLEPNTTYYLKVFNNYSPDTEGGNYKIQISYVLDPDKNEMENATQWNLEEKYYGDIAAKGDSDWFKITTGEETDYTFTLKNTNISTHSWSSDLQFRGTLYNDKKEILTSMYMTADKEKSVRIDLAPNTEYYIEIRDPQGTTGEYNFDLSVTVIIDEEAVGMENAAELKFDEEHYDEITNHEGDNKFDYLKFTTLSEPAYYTIYAKNIDISTHSWSSDNQVQVKVVDGHREEQGRFTLGPEAEGSVTLLLDTDTTYYIRINNNENNGGNYKALVTYVLDPEANEMESGKLLRIGERYYGNIAAKGDKDFFKITTGKETDLTLYLKNINIPTHSWSSDYQFRVVLYNKYNENLGQILATNGKEGNIKVTLEPDTTYYLGVWEPDGTTGDYNVILAESVLLGDVNLDGSVKIQDATLIQKYLAKLSTLTAQQLTTADVTEDGKVNIKDATAIQKYIAKITISFRVGELIMSEIQYDEPATEPETQINTEVAPTTLPVATTPAATTPVATEVNTEAPKTEPVEKPVVTTAVEEDPTEEPTTVAPVTTQVITEATDPTEEVTSTVATEPAETSTAMTTEVPTETVTEAQETETVPVTTEEPEIPTETVSNVEQLQRICELCEDLAEDKVNYKKEAPLTRSSQEIEKKAEFGYDAKKEDINLNEYQKFEEAYVEVYERISKGYNYTEEKAATLVEEITRAYVWFTYYTSEVHPQPSGRVIYFENSVNWTNPHVYYSKNGKDSPIEGDGIPMKKLDRLNNGNMMYSIEIPTGYDLICFNTGTKAIQSGYIYLSETDDDGFRLVNGKYQNGGMYYEVDNFEYPVAK